MHDPRPDMRTPNIAIFLDFENVAIGVRSARFGTFDVDLVLERLLDKGKIVVKKAYADWGRYRTAKRPLHESAFELIEIPHVSISGKNSADIRLVVDALDLCYTKDHIDLFVIVSGDSDFSPLVSKLRENDKRVIALGVKNSTSNLLVENCDEFIYYDDLVREKPNRNAKGKNHRPVMVVETEPGEDELATGRSERGNEGNDRGNGRNERGPGGGRGGERGPASERGPAGERGERNPERGGDKPAAERMPRPAPAGDPEAEAPEKPEGTLEERRLKALEMVLDTVESLFRERDDAVWGSAAKQTLKRKRPNFSESFHGYRTFNHLLEDARDRQLLEIQKDDRSGGYIIIGFGPNA